MSIKNKSLLYMKLLDRLSPYSIPFERCLSRTPHPPTHPSHLFITTLGAFLPLFFLALDLSPVCFQTSQTFCQQTKTFFPSILKWAQQTQTYVHEEIWMFTASHHDFYATVFFPLNLFQSKFCRQLSVIRPLIHWRINKKKVKKNKKKEKKWRKKTFLLDITTVFCFCFFFRCVHASL